jgi:capsular exopolysaccharide synthesis family protein
MDGPPQQQVGVRRQELRNAHARSRPGSGQGSHLVDQLNVIHKHRGLAVSVFLLIVLAVMLRTYTTTPLYHAQARLMIDMDDERTEPLVGVLNNNQTTYWRDPQVYYQTQYRILTGHEIGRRVVQRLNLARVPEFSGEGAPSTQLKGTLSMIASRATAPFARYFPNSLTRADPAPDESEVIGRFLARVSVDAVPNSRLVDVGFVSADPGLAMLAINTLADEYVQQNLELRRQNMVSSLAWLSQELVKQQKKVEDSERAMAQYREDQNALSLEERQNIVVARLNQLNDAVTKAKTNRVQKQALYDQVKTLDADVSPDTIPAILQNPYIQAIKTRLAELQREKATLLERYGEKYPEVLKVNASYQDASQQLQTEIAKAVEAIKNDYESAAFEERTLNAELDDQKAAAMDLNRKSVSYTVLERDAKSNRLVYESLLQREKELQVMANSRGNNVSVTDRAERPNAPFVPTPGRDLILAVVAGMVLSLGLVFFLEHLDDTVKSPDDVTDALNLPLLGLAPKVVGGPPLVSSPDVPHEFAEALRSLRTSLIFSSGAESTRVIMVTSAQPLEGKTTIACNLALVLAVGGARVLLIDADMRRPGVHRTLGLEDGTGLSHVLTGQARMDEACVPVEHPGLLVLRAGLPPPNPSELLGSEAMRALMEQTKNGRFDWVIFDTPPLLPVTDAVVLSSLVSGVALVIGSETTLRQHVVRGADALANSGARVIGAVLNRVNFDRNRYYYARYYGYRNRNGYYTSAEKS